MSSKVINVYFPVILVFTFLVSCNLNDELADRETLAPKVVAAKGYVVPKDSMAVPRVILIDESRLTKIPVGAPTIVATNTNIHPAGIPKIVPAGIPSVVELGQDNYQLPKAVSAIHKPLKAATPQVAIAKDPSQMDSNPQSFSSFGKLHGLKDGDIECMLEDRNGNLWISTHLGGVSKYDGKSFTNLPLNKGSTFRYVTCMMEDKEGNIWFGYAFEGVSKYDGKFITHFTKKEGLIDNEVRSMLEDKSGNLWFGTAAGVSQLSVDRKSFTHFTRKEGLLASDILSLFEDRQGNIWFGARSGGLTRMSRDRKTFSHFTSEEVLDYEYIEALADDQDGNLWFSNSGGVSRLSSDYKSITHFTAKEGLINNRVRTILEDKRGNIWFGHHEEGACRLSKDGTSFTYFTKKEGLNDNDVRSILEDRHGNLWLGTKEGVSKYIGTTFTHYTKADGLSDNYVWSIKEDKNGNLWFGHETGGVSRLNPDRKTFAHFVSKGFEGVDVMAILEERSGDLWFGTVDNGLIRLSADRKYFTYFFGLTSPYILSLFEDKAGNIWIGTVFDGVFRLSKDRKTFTRYSENEGLSHKFVSSIVEDNNGNLWFATANGVSRLGTDGRTFTNFASNNGFGDPIVWSALKDKGGNLWFGTDDGLSRLSSDQRFFTHFTEKEGLSNSAIYAMHEDKRGNLWFTTPFGINKLRVEKSERISNTGHVSGQDGTFLFKTFTYEDGFLGIGGRANSIFEDRNGQIWIGANNKLTVYHPGEDVDDTIPPNIQLTGVALFNENISWSQLEDKKDTSFVLGNGVSAGDFEFDRVSNWYFLPQNLSLAHHNNYVTFNFVGISLKSPQKVKYQYKLEGNDDDWSAITNRSDATYGNLPPGAYTFKVKAMNSEGYWSEEFNYGFIIRPPWWKTWWAYLLYSLAVIGIGFSWRSYEIKRLKLKHRAEHLSELDSLKTRFFANISHEFRTPITLILGPLRELYNKASSDGQKAELGTMMRNGQRLLRLVNQLIDLSKLEAGKMGLRASQTDLVQFLKEITSFYESLAIRKKIKFFFYPEPRELYIHLDQEKIDKVIHNILSNAFKFTNENGEVILNLKVDNNQYAVISVRDTGIGIPEHQLKKVFDRFYQVDNSQTRSYEGSGIGMALAKELVELHHGTISIESKEGNGSTFTVRLPLNKEYLRKEEIIEPIELKWAGLNSQEVMLEGTRVETSFTNEAVNETQPLLLIVEDNTEMRNYIVKILSDTYNIVEGVNGKDGMEKAGEFLPDLIISDIMMPEMDGITMTAKLKKGIRTCHIPIIMLTAKATDEAKITGLNAGADDYLLKPFSNNELILKVKNMIESRIRVRERVRLEFMRGGPFKDAISADEKLLQKVKEAILNRLSDEQLSVDSLAQQIGLSRAHFYRKITALTGLPVNELIRSFRLERGAQLLAQQWGPVAQIAYEVGFSNPSYFSKCFKDKFGVMPSEYLAKNKQH